jgi:hypothetical protein
MRIDDFRGDFDLLPIASDLRYRPVPLYPSSDEFQLAATQVADDLETHCEAHWYIEAFRWRRTAGYGKPLNDGLKTIALAVAARLYKIVTEAA